MRHRGPRRRALPHVRGVLTRDHVRHSNGESDIPLTRLLEHEAILRSEEK